MKSIHKSFTKINSFISTDRDDRLQITPWERGVRRVVKAVYLLVLDGVVKKVGQSIDFFRRMDDYKYASGYACSHLTPTINNMLRENKTNMDIYVRFYDQTLTRVDEWGEEVLQTDCVFAAERKWKDYYKETLIFD